MVISKKNVDRLGRIRDGVLNITLLPLSKLLPRSSEQWLFGHIDGLFAGNSKYLFLWISIFRPEMRAVWIAEDEKTRRLLKSHGLLAYRRWSVGGIVAALRSGVFVYCHSIQDTNTHLSGGAFLLNLWHGIGLKPTQFGDVRGGMALYREKHLRSKLGYIAFYQYLKDPDAVATTSAFMQAHFAAQFLLPPERCPILGYPRLDVSFDVRLRELAERIDADSGFAFNPDRFDEVYIYMPTWRDSRRSFLADALPDLKRLSSALRERNALLYIKLHSWTSEYIADEFDNIRNWPAEIEVFTYFTRFDSLITDYSSVLYDYLFVKQTGAVLYIFDYVHWMAVDRGLLYPFEENTAGLRVDDFDGLCDAIASGHAVTSSPGTAAVREKFWGECVAPVSLEIVRYVAGHLSGSRQDAQV